MDIYIATFIALGLAAVTDVLSRHRRVVGIVFVAGVLWLFLHDGLRWAVGTDWASYIDHFTNCLVGSNYQFETGYTLLAEGIRRLTENYAYLVLVHAAVLYLLLSGALFRLSPYPLVALFLFYCLMLRYLGMNREYLAFGVCMYATKYVLSRDWARFAICVAVASLFHTSALIFAGVYFLNRKLSWKLLAVLLIAACALSYMDLGLRLTTVLFSFSETSAEKLVFYTGNGMFDGFVSTILGLLKRLVMLFFAIYLSRGQRKVCPEFVFVANLYVCSTLGYIIFNNSSLQIIVARGLIYFNIAEVFLIGYIVAWLRDPALRLGAVLLAIGYGYLNLVRGIDVYKETLGIDVFRPYHTSLFISGAMLWVCTGVFGAALLVRGVIVSGVLAKDRRNRPQAALGGPRMAERIA